MGLKLLHPPIKPQVRSEEPKALEEKLYASPNAPQLVINRKVSEWETKHDL